ncbi:MAG: hypothetical protein H7839_24070, partial [Magnetococcus sp. YQC-5]
YPDADWPVDILIDQFAFLLCFYQSNSIGEVYMAIFVASVVFAVLVVACLSLVGLDHRLGHEPPWMPAFAGMTCVENASFPRTRESSARTLEWPKG